MKLLMLHFSAVPWCVASKQAIRSKNRTVLPYQVFRSHGFHSNEWITAPAGSCVLFCSHLGCIHSRAAVHMYIYICIDIFFASVLCVAHNLVHMEQALELIPTSITSCLLFALQWFFSHHCLNASQPFNFLIFICFRFFLMLLRTCTILFCYFITLVLGFHIYFF